MTRNELRDALADELMRQWPTTIWNRDAAVVTADGLLSVIEYWEAIVPPPGLNEDAFKWYDGQGNCTLCGHQSKDHGRGHCMTCERLDLKLPGTDWHCHASSMEEERKGAIAGAAWRAYMGYPR